MRPAVLIATAMALMPTIAGAQGGLSADFSFGAGADGNRTAVAALHRMGPRDGRFWFAIGARATAYAGDPVTFASRSEGADAFDGDVVIEPSVYGLNLMGEAGVHLGGRFGLGFNLDLLGIATGPDRATAAGTTSPSALSLFLYGNNDRGSLNSELFLAVRLSETARLRFGLSHYVMGYESTGNESFDATRFQRFLDAGFVAIRLGR